MPDREVWEGERYVNLGEFEQQLLRTVYRQTGKSSPTIAPPAYAGGMSSNPGGFLIPAAFRRAMIDAAEVRPVVPRARVVPMEPLMATKLAVYGTVSAEEIAEAEAMQAGWDLAYRLANGTATAEEKSAAAERAAAHRAEQDALKAAAVAEWEAVRLRYADSPAILAVLDIHQPVDYGYGFHCDHPISGWEAESEEWPCSTFEAIRDAVPSGSERA